MILNGPFGSRISIVVPKIQGDNVGMRIRSS